MGTVWDVNRDVLSASNQLHAVKGHALVLGLESLANSVEVLLWLALRGRKILVSLDDDAGADLDGLVWEAELDVLLLAVLAVRAREEHGLAHDLALCHWSWLQVQYGDDLLVDEVLWLVPVSHTGGEGAGLLLVHLQLHEQQLVAEVNVLALQDLGDVEVALGEVLHNGRHVRQWVSLLRRLGLLLLLLWDGWDASDLFEVSDNLLQIRDCLVD